MINGLLERRRNVAVRVAFILAGSALMAIGARIEIPLGVVPFTFQVLALALVVTLIGAEDGAFAMCAYLAEGAAGLPVFADGFAGAAVLVGPTAGYLWAYPLAAYLIGRFYEFAAARNAFVRFGMLLVGLAVIYAGGVAVLTVYTGFRTAVAVGVLPFIGFDILKMAFAAGIADLWRRVGHAR